MEKIILLVEKFGVTAGHGETEELLLLGSRLGPNRTKEYYPAFASQELAEEFMREMCDYPNRIQSIPFYRFKPGHEPEKEMVSIEFSLPCWYSVDEWRRFIMEDRKEFTFERIRTDLEKTEHVFRATTDDNWNFFELGMAVSRILE